ncbi:response regulator [Microbacterium sp. 179-I 3D4 NHS]|uniref:response regulator n=1 Tax=Microbacterium sp. 179-I 3D4 NHS TaxID=3142381 RepID=UPI0039A1EE61
MSGRPLALVVEDDSDQMSLLRRYLDREGYDVFPACDAETAIAAFPDIDPELAVLDLLLPGISGHECARLVQEAFPRCFLVISSVLDPLEYPRADAALPKPVIRSALHHALAGAGR